MSSGRSDTGFDYSATRRGQKFLMLFTIEICEDMWTPFNPSMQSLAHGAELVLNLSASNSIYEKVNTETS